MTDADGWWTDQFTEPAQLVKSGAVATASVTDGDSLVAVALGSSTAL